MNSFFHSFFIHLSELIRFFLVFRSLLPYLFGLYRVLYVSGMTAINVLNHHRRLLLSLYIFYNLFSFAGPFSWKSIPIPQLMDAIFCRWNFTTHLIWCTSWFHEYFRPLSWFSLYTFIISLFLILPFLSITLIWSSSLPFTLLRLLLELFRSLKLAHV